MTYDTGAAVAALPKRFEEGSARTEANGSRYQPCSGQECFDHGGVKVNGQDANGNKISVKGRLADVAKLLVSGNEVSKGSDVFITEGQGFIMLRHLEATG